MQEGLAFGLFLLVAGPFPLDAAGQRLARSSSHSVSVCDPFVGVDRHLSVVACHPSRSDGLSSEPRRDVGLDVEIALLVDPVDLAQLGHRLAGDEVRQRHQPVRRCAPSACRASTAPGPFRAGARGSRFPRPRMSHPHRVQQDAARDQLHHAAHRGHVGAVAPGLFDIDVDLPVDAGQGAGVLDLDQALGVFEFLRARWRSRPAARPSCRPSAAGAPACPRPGRALRFRISVWMPGIRPAVLPAGRGSGRRRSRRRSSSVSRRPAGLARIVGRSSQRISSICTWPMVSSGPCAPPVFGIQPAVAGKGKGAVDAVDRPARRPRPRLTSASFSVSDRLPRART